MADTKNAQKKKPSNSGEKNRPNVITINIEKAIVNVSQTPDGKNQLSLNTPEGKLLLGEGNGGY